MQYPDYQGASIVNLTSSILRKYEIFSQYPPLNILPQEIIADSTNLVFFIIDGLGYDFLQDYGQHTIFHEYTRGKMSSVFPSTTASAMLSYYTGLSPFNHGIPAWFTYLRQIGLISTILPFTPRNKRISLTEFGVNPKEIYNFSSLFEKIKDPQYMFMPEEIINMPLNNLLNQYRIPRGYSDIKDLFRKLNQLLNDNQGKSNFIFVYWPKLDSLAHEFGVSHQKTLDHLDELDWYFKNNVTQWKAQDPFMRVITSADHGLIDIPMENQLKLEQYPILYNSLILPLSGEGRVPFFYVRSDKKDQFLEQMALHFKGLGKLFSRQELIDSHLMGLFDMHPELTMRLGDYIFIFEKPYILKDRILGEEGVEMVGHHGGLSSDELYVPLIVF